jgi:hypothetical protein
MLSRKYCPNPKCNRQIQRYDKLCCKKCWRLLPRQWRCAIPHKSNVIKNNGLPGLKHRLQWEMRVQRLFMLLDHPTHEEFRSHARRMIEEMYKELEQNEDQDEAVNNAQYIKACHLEAFVMEAAEVVKNELTLRG